MLLKEAFPDWRTNGIFKYIEIRNVPWSTSLSDYLDLEYFANRSGNKIVSPLVDILSDGEALTNENRTLIAAEIRALFMTNCEKEYATISAQYNPIQNYDMTESLSNDVKTVEYGHTNTRTDDLTHTRTDDLTITRTDDLTHTKNGTETQTPDLTDSTDNAVYGFNSETAVPTGQQSRTSTGTNETEYDLTDTDSGTVTNTDEGTVTNTDEGTVTDVESGADTHRHSYTLTRSGNIGVTTSQQMLQSERDLWIWNYFRDVVFPDVDKVLTIKIY